jgi:type II secretory pathway pseudopilin PulG
MKSSPRSGFVLPVVLCSMLVVGILAGSALNLILNATRSAGAYTSATHCRLSAQSALDREKAETLRAFRAYFRTSPSTWNLLAWFDTTSETSVGLSGYENPLCQNDSINGCTVSVTLLAVTRTPVTAVNQFARLTLRAVASSTTPAGIPVTRVIEETVEYGLRRASVFDYAYFVNNYGWFMGGASPPTAISAPTAISTWTATPGSTVTPTPPPTASWGPAAPSAAPRDTRP